MAVSILYNEVLPFIVIIATEAILVGINVMYKAATLKGLSYYVLIVYSYSISSIILLFPLLYVLKRFAAELCGVQGMQSASPTLSSALSILIPIFTFILAVLFRMEKLALRSKSTQAKILGTILSIIGALLVVLYKGQIIFSNSNSLLSPATDSPISLSSPRNWVIGGSLLVVQYLLLSIILTLQGILNACLSTLVYTWAVRLKGALYVSMFRPASIVIAATLSIIFLGDSLYVGT
ncbi:unnamed protein product [Lupinus luteus]|uniref:WAT1-related protein n=1 Tax=Lupinus luteus TaxID=3873 RepID=A0AAV1WUA3_LUPLU